MKTARFPLRAHEVMNFRKYRTLTGVIQATLESYESKGIE